MRSKLSALWIFATLNYLYCDVVSLMDSDLLRQYLAGRVGGVDVTQGFLLAAGVLVEVPMAMVLLSRFLEPRANRWANVGVAGLMTAVQLATLFVKTPAPYYAFFSGIEIACTAVIAVYSWRSQEVRNSSSERSSAGRSGLSSSPESR